MAEVTLTAERRQDSGKGVARKLRQGGKIPAVVYGRGRETESLTISLADFEKILSYTHAGAAVIELTIDDSKVRTLVRDIQRHPTTKTVTHVDFLEIHAGERIKVNVPVELIGSPEGVRNAGGVLEQFLREIEIDVLPRHIPEHVEIDVTELGVNRSLHVRDVIIENAKILTDPDGTVCAVVPPRVEEEPGAEEIEEEAGEPELIRKPKAEGEEEGAPEGETAEE
jgi:large subunit ribosomal protein L25